MTWPDDVYIHLSNRSTTYGLWLSVHPNGMGYADPPSLTVGIKCPDAQQRFDIRGKGKSRKQSEWWILNLETGEPVSDWFYGPHLDIGQYLADELMNLLSNVLEGTDPCTTLTQLRNLTGDPVRIAESLEELARTLRSRSRRVICDL